MTHVIGEVLNPEGETWGEFVCISSADQKALEGILTPRAFRVLIRSEKSFEHLLCICSQRFSKLPIFALTPQRGIAPPSPVPSETDIFSVSIGEEVVFAFYHRGLALVAVPSEANS